jgi:hypothetical protein
MTSGRFWPLPAALAGALALLLAPGCGENVGQPCTTQCGQIEGSYELHLGDAGVPADCANLGVRLPEGPLAITRAGAQLGGSVEGVTMRGTLYQSGDFTLLGSRAGSPDGGTGDSTSFSFNGRFQAAREDAGTPASLAGTFNGTYTRSGGPGGAARTCTVNRPYTATRED